MSPQCTRSAVTPPELPFELIPLILAHANGLRVLHIAACTSRAWRTAAERTRRSWKLLGYLDSRKRQAAPKLRYPCAMLKHAGQPVTTFVVAEEQYLISCAHTEGDPLLFGTRRRSNTPPQLRGSNGPSGLALYTPDSGPQHLFISDAGRDMVYRYAFDSRGPWKWEYEFGGFGTDGGSFVSPGDLCIVEHSLYVAEAHAISIFALPEVTTTFANEPPTYVSKFGSRGSAPGEFLRGIGGLAASPQALDDGASLFACDTGNHRVQVFTAAGTLVRAFGRKGDAPGEFNKPAAIAILLMSGVDRSTLGASRVVVGETVGKRIQVLSAAGAPLQLISTLPAPHWAAPQQRRRDDWRDEAIQAEIGVEREAVKARVACFAYDERGRRVGGIDVPVLHAASASSDAVLHAFAVVSSW